MKAAASAQLTLPLAKKPRKRRRVGRKLVPLGRRPAPERVGFMPHATRAVHDANHPVHVTIRRVVGGPSFRAQRICAAIRQEIARCKRKGVRVLHYSVQENHLHLMVEAASAGDLSHQMRTLFSRIAVAVNAIVRRHGRLFRDRHHRHALKTPREVRNALVYILTNGSYCSTSLRSRNDEVQLAGRRCGWLSGARTQLLRDAMEHVRAQKFGPFDDPGAARYGP